MPINKMKLEYQKLPRYILEKDGSWRIYDYEWVLVPVPETDEEVEALEE